MPMQTSASASKTKATPPATSCITLGSTDTIDPVTAAKMLSTNPARHIGLEETVGSIQPGKQADLVIANQDFRILAVLKNGKKMDSR